jgi:predicted dehydrogenase
VIVVIQNSSSPAAAQIRYAVVGLGFISQDAVLPAFSNTPNSVLAALVTGDRRKAKEVGSLYGVERTCSYEEYDNLLRSGDIDAVYIAVPDTLHCDFTLRAAQAGIHVLCEKPLAESEQECFQMIEAAKVNRIKLMTAYRLHFEAAHLWAMNAAQQGRLGDLRVFHSVFSMQAAEGNTRLSGSLCGGSLYDMGVYCTNAARYMFRDEPTEVFGWSLKSGDNRFREVLETVCAMLRFPGDRVASFTCSYGAATTDMFEVIGSDGVLRIQPAFDYHKTSRVTVTLGGTIEEKTFARQDQFGAQLLYFSNCILNNEEPEPDGQEGLADVQIIQGILRSADSGTVVPLELPPRSRRPDISQQITLPPVEPRGQVNVMIPGR